MWGGSLTPAGTCVGEMCLYFDVQVGGTSKTIMMNLICISK